MLFDITGNIILNKTNTVVDIQLKFAQLLKGYLLTHSKGDNKMTAITLGHAYELMSYFQEN